MLRYHVAFHLPRAPGEMVVAEASPKALRILARAALVPATVRAYPALADGKIYVRNERTLGCFSMK